MTHIEGFVIYELLVTSIEIIIRRTSKYDLNRLPPIPKLDIELLNKKSNMNSNFEKS